MFICANGSICNNISYIIIMSLAEQLSCTCNDSGDQTWRHTFWNALEDLTQNWKEIK